MLHTKRTARNSVLLLFLALVIGFIAMLTTLAGALSLRGLYAPIQWVPSQLSIMQKSSTSLRLKVVPIPVNSSLEHYARFSLSGTRLQPANTLVKARLSDGTILDFKASPDSNAERLTFPITPSHSLNSTLSEVQIIFQGERQEGASILHIDLEPRPGALSFDNLQSAHQALWQAWMSREGLNVYSAHFIVGGEKASYISSPVLAGLLWFGLSLLIGWVFTHKRLTPSTQLTALALMTLFIWSVLDLRWQRDLWLEHGEDLNTSASAAIHAVDLQANRIQRVLSAANQRPNPRVFILSTEAFDRLRLRYALLPLNTHAETRALNQLIPELRPGDTLVLVLPQKDISTHLARNQISSGGYTLEVKPLLAEPHLAVVTVLAIQSREAQDAGIKP